MSCGHKAEHGSQWPMNHDKSLCCCPGQPASHVGKWEKQEAGEWSVLSEQTGDVDPNTERWKVRIDNPVFPHLDTDHTEENTLWCWWCMNASVRPHINIYLYWPGQVYDQVWPHPRGPPHTNPTTLRLAKNQVSAYLHTVWRGEITADWDAWGAAFQYQVWTDVLSTACDGSRQSYASLSTTNNKEQRKFCVKHNGRHNERVWRLISFFLSLGQVVSIISATEKQLHSTVCTVVGTHCSTFRWDEPN